MIATNEHIGFDEAVLKLRELFLDSVRLHLRSDVPLGIALSGGVDSSAVVSTVRYLEPELIIKTFSYIASDPQISEEKWVDLLNEEVDALSHKIRANRMRRGLIWTPCSYSRGAIRRTVFMRSIVFLSSPRGRRKGNT